MNSYKNIVIAPCGSSISAHKEWIKGDRGFDLFLVNYSEELDLYREDADYYLNLKGLKLSILKQAIESHKDIIQGYDTVWLPDDDLSISTEEINGLFDIFHSHNLEAAQPAVKNNFCNYRFTSKRFLSKLRYVNFIEMMCPLFRTDVLFEILPLFSSNKSGFGIDWLWSHRLNGRKVAIIDLVGVIHTKPCLHEGAYYDKVKAMGVDEREESALLLSTHGVTRAHTTSSVVYTNLGEYFSRIGLASPIEFLLRGIAKSYYFLQKR